MLVQRNSNPQTPLTFPTQTLSCYTTTKFCLFPMKHTNHTVFKNPLFKQFSLNCGGYGQISQKPFGTNGNSSEFLEYYQNALNLNGTQTDINKEIINSLCNTETYNENTGLYSNDKTNFFIALPTETDITYQQGLISLSPINFEINVTQRTGVNTSAEKVNTPPLLCFLYDSSISILVPSYGMPP